MKFIPTIGGELSGSAGGIVASRNKGGAYLRRRAVPTNPNTIRQATARNRFASASQRWSQLTQANRDAWIAWATNNPTQDRIGQTITLSGQQAYVRAIALVQALTDTSIDEYDNAPLLQGLLSAPVPDPTINVLTQDLGNITFGVLLNNPVDEGGTYGLFVSPPISPSIRFYKGPYQFMDSTTVALNAVNVGFSFAQTLLPVPLAAGQARAVRIRGVSDSGRPSPDVQAIVGVNIVE